MLKFSRSEVAVLGFILALALVAVGYHLGASSKEKSNSFMTVESENPTQSVTKSPSNRAKGSVFIRVQVAGEVVRPGVYTLQEDSRVEDALRAAGGFTQKASVNSVNQAEKLKDGEQIVVSPVIVNTAQTIPITTSVPKPVIAKSPTTPSHPQVNTIKSAQNTDQPPQIPIIALNSADQSTLEKLPGVGPGLAEKILQYRNERGGFKSVEELKEVPGIGEKRFEKIRFYVHL